MFEALDSLRSTHCGYRSPNHMNYGASGPWRAGSRDGCAIARFAICFLFPVFAFGQTFRGEISGTIQDTSAARVARCAVEAVHLPTNLAFRTLTGETGAFALVELPAGAYSLTVNCPGFASRQAQAMVRLSTVTFVSFEVQPAALTSATSVEAVAEPIEVNQSSRAHLVGEKLVQDLPLNGRDFLRLIRLAPGVVLQGTSFYAVNGNRGRSNNFQIDGADNNDAWQNASAANQGGVSAIPNSLIPVEAIDQFALQAVGNAEQGRNSGANINLALKSGTNQFHGTLFYFNRNEALAAPSPVAPSGSPQRKIRTQQYGFSLGGPVVRDRTFFFTTWEGQRLKLGNTLLSTAPSEAWQERGRAVLRAFGLTENPVARNLLSLWPANGRGAPAAPNNFFNNADNDFRNDNGVAKVDHAFDASSLLTVRYFQASGTQTAFSGSPYREYFQVATNQVRSVAATWSRSFSPVLVNQIVAGFNYYHPTFTDNDRSANPVALGFNTGVTDPGLLGTPTINVAGFAGVGPTQPQGRRDTTWHITDTLTWLRGAHQWKVGGEFRSARLDVFNETNKLGTFNFDGAGGPWATGTPEQRALGATFSQPERVMADLMGGYLSPNNGARIVRGALARDMRQPSVDWFVHDTWQASRTLSLNFGVRYTYLSPLRDTRNSLTTFLPDQGIVAAGTSALPHLYPRDWNNFGLRAGLAWQPAPGSNWVLRAGYGIYFDTFHNTYFLSNTTANAGASGLNANPGGPDPVFTLSRSGFQVQPNQPLFGGVQPVAPFGAYSVSQDLALPYVQNFHLTLQRQLGRRANVSVAYVGSLGRKLPITVNLNAPLPGVSGSLQERRPFNSRFPLLGTINQLETAGNSAYNSLQAVFNTSGWKGLSGRIAYTYSTAIDFGSDARFILPANSYDRRRERGPADFDARHVVVAGLVYEVPGLRFGPPRLTRGWSLNTFTTYHTGLPVDIRAGQNVSNSFDGVDRVDVVGDPFAGIVQPANSTARRLFNSSAFARPANGSFGNIGRNALAGPSFGAVDFSVIKSTAIKERIATQFRVEVFNLFNRTNWANPGNSLAAATSFGLMTNTRNGGGAPGIGPGEPRSVQLALKLMF